MTARIAVAKPKPLGSIYPNIVSILSHQINVELRITCSTVLPCGVFPSKVLSSFWTIGDLSDSKNSRSLCRSLFSSDSSREGANTSVSPSSSNTPASRCETSRCAMRPRLSRGAAPNSIPAALLLATAPPNPRTGGGGKRWCACVPPECAIARTLRIACRRWVMTSSLGDAGGIGSARDIDRGEADERTKSL